MSRATRKSSRGVGASTRNSRKALSERISPRAVVISSLLLNLVLCLLFFDPKPHTGGDNASYVVLAESILRTGDGYTDHIGPGPARPHTQYPFGYPLLLAPIVALFGRSFLTLKAFSVLMSLGTVLFFALLARRLVDKKTWAVLSLAVGVNPVIVDYSHWVLSEGTFLFFSTLSLYFLIRAESVERERFGTLFWLAVVSLAFTAHIRSIGVAFAAAGGVYYLVRRKWRRLIVFGLAMGLLLAPWMVRNRLVGESDAGYGSQLLMKNPYSPELGTVSPGDMVARVWKNVVIYGSGEMGRVVFGSESGWARSGPGRALSLVASLLVLAGLGRRMRRGFGILEAYFLVYLAIVLLWPEAWSDVRFIVPVIPLLLLYLSEGAGLVASLPARGDDIAVRAAAWTAAAVISISGAAQLARAPENFKMLADYAHGDRYAGYYPNWRTFFEAADWVKANTPEDAVVTVRKPSLFHVWTGRKVDGYPFSTDPDTVLSSVFRTDYVIIDQVSGTTYRYLVPAVQKMPERFRAVFQTGEPVTWVLEVVE